MCPKGGGDLGIKYVSKHTCSSTPERKLNGMLVLRKNQRKVRFKESKSVGAEAPQSSIPIEKSMTVSELPASVGVSSKPSTHREDADANRKPSLADIDGPHDQPIISSARSQTQQPTVQVWRMIKKTVNRSDRRKKAHLGSMKLSPVIDDVEAILSFRELDHHAVLPHFRYQL